MKLTWRSMHEVLTKLSEEEVLKLLQEEQAGANRITILLRLHQLFQRVDASDQGLQLA